MKLLPALCKYLLFALLLGAAMPAQAQFGNFFFTLKPAHQKGSLLYQAGAFEKAIPHLEQAVKKQPDNQLRLMLAHAYALTGQAQESVRLYRQLGQPQALEAKHLLAYTLSLQAAGKPEEAHASFKLYLSRIGDDSELPADLGKSDLYRTAIRYSVRSLSINTPQHEFGPLLTKEGLLFLSDRKTRTLVNRRFSSHPTDLDVFEAQARSNTRFVNTRGLGSAVNTALHEGPGSLDSAGNFYFSRSERDGRMSLWRAEAQQEKGGWEKAQMIDMPGVGNAFHPAVHPHGHLLFFVSDRPGGLGGTDIYYSLWQQEGGWSAPVNAGPKINTQGNEAFPSLHNNKLYFSSDGRVGLGRLDIYEAFLSATTVLHVRNVGAPVNSPEDDFGLAWLADGTGGYFASNRKGGRGGDDLYRLDYHIIQLEGVMLDSTNHKPMAGVKVELLNPDGSVRKFTTNDAGAFQVSVFPGENYLISAEAKSYKPRSLSYSTMQGKQYGKRIFTMALERKTKIFLLGNVRLPQRKRAAGAQVMVFDQAGGRPDTLQANERGSFEVELDAESSYTLMLACNNMGALADFRTDSRSEASLSHYLNVDLKPALAYQVQARIEGADPHLPLVVWLSNSLSPDSELIWPDQNSFSFSAHSLLGYEICVQQGEKSGVLYLKSGWEKETREVVVKLK